MVDKLKEMLRKNPFVPFNIVMNSGHSYHVADQWQVAIGKTVINYLYPSSDAEANLEKTGIRSLEQFEAAEKQ